MQSTVRSVQWGSLNTTYPHEGLRRRLAAMGLPPERHELQAMLQILPAGTDAVGFGFDADAVAEVLIYLVGRKLLNIPCALEASLSLGWGAHLCQLYRSPQELLELVVPFFKRGLKDHERCMWVVRAPLSVDAARQALSEAIPDLESYSDQISFHEHQDWYLDPSGNLKPVELLLDAWVSAEKRALDQGYLGLRVAGEPLSCGERRDELLEYEAQVHKAIGKLRIKALCTYCASSAPAEVAALMCSHDAAYVKQEQGWQRVAAAGPRSTESILA